MLKTRLGDWRGEAVRWFAAQGTSACRDEGRRLGSKGGRFERGWVRKGNLEGREKGTNVSYVLERGMKEGNERKRKAETKVWRGKEHKIKEGRKERGIRNIEGN